jgi:hypothetical protein
MGSLCFRSARADKSFWGSGKGEYKERLLDKDSCASRTEMTQALSSALSFEFNDTVLKTSLTVSEYAYSPRNTLTYSSLTQVLNYQVGSELICMSWNLNYDPDSSPFKFFSDFRNLDVPENDCVTNQLLWDVAHVFRSINNPTEFSKTITIESVVPSDLLSQKALNSFCDTVKISDKERETVMQFPKMSLYVFMLAMTYDTCASGILHNGSSIFETNKRCPRRASNPLQPHYIRNAFKKLLHQDPTLLPVLILDSLHTLIIRFSSFLLYNNLQKAFSEYETSEQMEKFSLYSLQNNPNDHRLPRHFKNVRNVLCQKWKTVFGDANQLRQVQLKMDMSNADIVLLQNITSGVFNLLRKELLERFYVFPVELPMELKKTSVICLKKATVLVEKTDRTFINHSNFAVLCRSSDILFYVAVVSLTPGNACGEIRKQEATSFKRLLRKGTPVVIGGYFNEDLTALSNPVARIMLKSYNGLDQNQELACTINATKTNLQFEVTGADKIVKGLDNGIFSSFPFTGNASTDFLYPGRENPCDYGPIFQRIVCMI